MTNAELREVRERWDFGSMLAVKPIIKDVTALFTHIDALQARLEEAETLLRDIEEDGCVVAASSVTSLIECAPKEWMCFSCRARAWLEDKGDG